MTQTNFEIPIYLPEIPDMVSFYFRVAKCWVFRSRGSGFRDTIIYTQSVYTHFADFAYFVVLENNFRFKAFPFS